MTPYIILPSLLERVQSINPVFNGLEVIIDVRCFEVTPLLERELPIQSDLELKY